MRKLQQRGVLVTAVRGTQRTQQYGFVGWILFKPNEASRTYVCTYVCAYVYTYVRTAATSGAWKKINFLLPTSYFVRVRVRTHRRARRAPRQSPRLPLALMSLSTDLLPPPPPPLLLISSSLSPTLSLCGRKCFSAGGRRCRCALPNN